MTPNNSTTAIEWSGLGHSCSEKRLSKVSQRSYSKKFAIAVASILVIDKQPSFAAAGIIAKKVENSKTGPGSDLGKGLWKSLKQLRGQPISQGQEDQNACPALCPDDSHCKYKGGGLDWDWRADCNEEGYKNIKRERDTLSPSMFDRTSVDACKDALNDMKVLGIDVNIDEDTFLLWETNKPPGCYIACNEGILSGHFNSNAYNHISNPNSGETEPLCQRDLPSDNLYWLDFFKGGHYFVGSNRFTYSDNDCPFTETPEWSAAESVDKCKERCMQKNLNWDRGDDLVPPCTSIAWDSIGTECALRKCLEFPLLLAEESSTHAAMAQNHSRYNRTQQWIQDYTLSFFDLSPSSDTKCYPGEKLRRIRAEEGHQTYGSFVCESEDEEVWSTDLPHPNADNPKYRNHLPVDFFWDKTVPVFNECWTGMSDAIESDEYLTYWFAVRLDYNWQQHYSEFEAEYQRRGYSGVMNSFMILIDQVNWLFEKQFQVTLKISRVVLQNEHGTWPDNPWRPGDAGVIHFTGGYNGGGGLYQLCLVNEIIVGGNMFKHKADWEENQDYPHYEGLNIARTLAHELAHHFGHGHNPAYMPDIQVGEGLTSYRRCADPENPGEKKVCSYRSFQKFTSVPMQHNYNKTICEHLRSMRAQSCGVIAPLVPLPSPSPSPAPQVEYCPLGNGTALCPNGISCKYKGGGTNWDWRADCNEEGYDNIKRERERDYGDLNKASEDACKDALVEMQSLGVNIRIGTDVRIAGSNSVGKEPIFSVYLEDKPVGCYVTCDGGELYGYFNRNAWNRANNPWHDAEPLCVKSSETVLSKE